MTEHRYLAAFKVLNEQRKRILRCCVRQRATIRRLRIQRDELLATRGQK